MSRKTEAPKRADSRLRRARRWLVRGADASPVTPLPREEFTHTYQKYCKQLDKEDTLINNRVNWLLASQSLLFTALAIGETGAGAAFRGAIASIVPVFGFSSALLMWLSVLGAIRSFFRYRYLLGSVCPVDDARRYPQLHRDRCNIVLGHISPLLLPPLLIGVWLWIWL